MRTPVKRGCQASLEQRWQVLREKIERHALPLQNQGVILAKQVAGRQVWVLRFVERNSGRRVHRSIFIGGDDRPELLGLARGLLGRYREQHRRVEEAAACARTADAVCAVLRRPGGGRNRRE